MKTLSQLLFENNKRFFVTTSTANIIISFAMSFKTYIFNLSIKGCRESFLKYYVATLIWQMGSKQIQRTKKKNLRRKSLSPFNLVQINILFIRLNITFTWSVAFVYEPTKYNLARWIGIILVLQHWCWWRDLSIPSQ